MNRRGFVLLILLWVVAMLGVLSAVGLSVSRRGAYATRNRIVLARAAWAREACLAILRARYAEKPGISGLDSIDLGRGAWCRVDLDDPASRLDLNQAGAEALRRLMGEGRDSLVDALLDWRDPDGVPRLHGAEAEWYLARGRRPPRNGPFASELELAQVRGFEGRVFESAVRHFTTRSAGPLNLNAAPVAALATLPGLDAEAVEMIGRRRSAQHPIMSAEELATLLSKTSKDRLYANYQDFLRAAAFAPATLVATVEGGVRGYAVRSRMTVTLVPLPARLAVVRREVG